MQYNIIPAGAFTKSLLTMEWVETDYKDCNWIILRQRIYYTQCYESRQSSDESQYAGSLWFYSKCHLFLSVFSTDVGCRCFKVTQLELLRNSMGRCDQVCGVSSCIVPQKDPEGCWQPGSWAPAASLSKKITHRGRSALLIQASRTCDSRSAFMKSPVWIP